MAAVVADHPVLSRLLCLVERAVGPVDHVARVVPAWNSATPMLTVTSGSCGTSGWRSAIRKRMRSATAAALSRLLPGITTANSSPP